MEPSIYWEKEGALCRVEPVPAAPLARWAVFRSASEWDVVILQKKTSLSSVDLWLLQRSNPRILYDVDDAVMFQEMDSGRPLSGRHFQRFLRTVRASHTVVAGNRFLARIVEAAGRPVAILPTPVDPERYRPLQRRGISQRGPVVGWIGLSHNQKYLEPLLPVFGNLGKEFPGLRLRIVSDKLLLPPAEFIEWKPWTLDGEPEDIASFDVGIMPLADTLWTWGKCGYKIIQYFASGVPVVASPVGLNVDIVREGVNGFLAGTGEEWQQKLSTMLSSPVVAREMGERGRLEAESRYSVHSYAKAYLEILRGIIPRQP
jgi:glycosyltransferase involved in cell wall biosynthesis